ncbi:MAG: DUF1841 family protein [Methylophaga sp.]
MMFGQNRQQLRQFFFDVWSKIQHRQPLEGLELVLAHIIDMHPEYHSLLSDPDNRDKDFIVETGESNPFLHMGLHISLHEQVNTDRPSGIRALYQQLLLRFDNAHDCEHAMMDCLAETLWQSQRSGQPPSDELYLQALHRLLEQN